MNEFIEQFLLESRELVEQATSDLLVLEAEPGDKDRIDSAFRAFHTLKGAAGIVDFYAMGRVLHAAEDVLSAVRAGDDPVTPGLIGDCLTCLDQVVQWLDTMEISGEPPTDEDAAVDAIIRRFSAMLPAADGAQTTQTAKPDPPDSAWALALMAHHPGGAARTAIRYVPAPDCFFKGIDPMAQMEALPGLIALHFHPQATWQDLNEMDPFDCCLVLTALSSAPPEAVAATLPASAHVELINLATIAVEAASKPGLSLTAQGLLEEQILLLSQDGEDGFSGRLGSARRVAVNVLRHQRQAIQAERIDAAAQAAQARRDAEPLRTALQGLLAREAIAPAAEAPLLSRDSPEAVARTLRVEIERIDALVKLVGELTVTKNALGHAAALARSGGDVETIALLLQDQHGQLDRLAGQLQAAVLGMRILPFRQVFQRFPRLVRDMALSLGKPAQLVIEGDATEADKSIVEALFEPLLHVMRNAMDHGIEPPERRAALGKPTIATLQLRAARRGDQVVVELEDDGQGVDLGKVRAVAAERGMASAAVLSALSEAEVLDLVFAPGFSTAKDVTELSGRGVGLDAVRASLTRIGGQVALQSQPGAGSLTRFTLPFTVMMTAVLTVEAGGQKFGVPLDAAIETLKVSRERILGVGAAHAFIWRDRTLPLINLAEALIGGVASSRSGVSAIVVATAAGQAFGLEVDRIGETMDIMLKPLEGLLAGMPGIAGATLMGDGQVLIILDLAELLR